MNIKIKIIIFIIILVTVSLVLGLTLGLKLRKDKDNENVPDDGGEQPTSSPSIIGREPLSMYDLVTNWENSKQWKILSKVTGKDLSGMEPGTNDTLYNTFPAGSYKPSASPKGGLQFYAQPSVFSTRSACIEYQVIVPDNFNWVKGGKLPGLFIGETGANGGNHIEDGCSVRVMWRANGGAEAYVYVPNGSQLPDYEKIPGFKGNTGTGDSLWRNLVRLNYGVNTIKIFTQLNSFQGDKPQYDGIIRLNINDVSYEYNQMQWTTDKNTLINGIMFQTFFGGSDSTWATPTNQKLLFKNFYVSNNSSLC
eukprot:gene7887-9706_t